MRKLRVLTVLHELSLTGAPKIGIDACQEMREDVETFFLSLGGGPLEGRCREAGRLHIISDDHQVLLRGILDQSGSFARRTWMGAKRARAKRSMAHLAAQVKEWQPDVIYVNSVVSLHLLELLELPTAPMLLHVHELDVAIRLGLGDRSALLTTKPDKYIAVAEPVRRLLVDRFSVPEDRIALIHEFVPDADFHSHALVKKESTDRRFVVGGAGMPQWRKGTTLWLQTAVELKKIMGTQIRFVWVGVRDNYDSVFFQEEARKLKVDDIVDFIPATKTPLQHYAKFDVFAMTSYEDPCPLVVLENMMLGNPVFCFAGSGGAAEEVGDAEVVVEDFSPRAMACKIASLASSPERRAELGAFMKARVGSMFLSSVQVPKILAELRSLSPMHSPPVVTDL